MIGLNNPKYPAHSHIESPIGLGFGLVYSEPLQLVAANMSRLPYVLLA